MAELVLALDLPAREEALRLLDRLPSLRWVKVGQLREYDFDPATQQVVDWLLKPAE